MRQRARLPAHGPRAGFSITEVLIASTILALVLGSTAMVAVSSTRAQQFTGAKAKVQDIARRAADRVADELLNASATGLFPDPQPFGTSDVLFQVAEGVTGGAIDWSAPKRLSFQYDTGEIDDGIDNNGNGLVDEGVLVLTIDAGGPSELSVVLCRGVRELLEGEVQNGVDDNGNGLIDEPGFSVQRSGDLLVVRISIEKPGPEGGTLISTVETGVQLRN
jgi:prepilin-type N-terminal cleavage/methylation domain-containing protein